ncbi:MAG TPA: response regulator [Chloroflexia bacterium]|nr:response regulator [Chloroflexia bacterium]
MTKQIMLFGNKSGQPARTRFILETLGSNVIEEAHWLDGLNAAATLHPDLILIETWQPDINTLEFCKALKRNLQTRFIPIIMYSDESDSKAILTAYNYGVDYYIVKSSEAEIELPLFLKVALSRVSQRLLQATA